MSVQSNQYAGFGYFINYKQAISALEARYDGDKIEELFDSYHDSAFKKEVVRVNGFSMIDDGMSANYIFFGLISDKSECYESLQVVKLKTPGSKTKNALKEEIINIFGKDFYMKPQSIVFTHYR